MGTRRPTWRWANVPIPEPHVGALIVGGVLHLLRPSTAVDDRRRGLGVGIGLIGIGLLLIAWSVRTIGNQESQRPTALVTGGPYAFSRNPMYVGWTALYLGIAVVVNTVYLFVLLPLVLAACHRVVRREERSLEREFGDEYCAYRRKVRRYL